MRDDQRQFFSVLAHPPARLNVEQAAWTLNFQPHDIPVLVSQRLLRPLGNPPRNGAKYFATREILALAADLKWLAKATNAIHEHWRSRNSSRSDGLEPFA